jgi:site-specific recombinase XerD
MEERDYASFIQNRIDSDPKINEKNKEALRKFINFLQANSAKQKTLDRHAYSYEKLLEKLPSNKPILSLSKEELIELVARINKMTNINNITRAKVLVTLKMMYKHFLGEDLWYPPQVAWIKTKEKPISKLTHDDLLTKEEVCRMINQAVSLRDKALIALMGDAPLRTHELLKLRRKNLNLSTNPPILIIPEDTKTGTRQIPLIDSVPAMIAYTNANKDMRGDDFLFTDSVYGKGLPMTSNALRMLLKRLATKAGIKKRVIPYTFRHTKITEYSNSLSNAQLEVVAGWMHGTNMHMTYEHLSNSDVTEAILKSKGIIHKTEIQKPNVRNCPRCELSNDINSAYCTRCGSPLDIVTAMKTPVHEGNMKEAIAEALKDPKVIEDVVHSYLLMQAKKGKK